jgi:hypothetical protein
MKSQKKAVIVIDGLSKGVSELGKEHLDNFNQEIRSIYNFTPKKYSFIKSQDMFGYPI